MAKVMKPPSAYSAESTDTGFGGDYYDGPPPSPGVYKGVVKRMIMREIKNEQRIMVLCEITDGKYKGAGVTKWLQLTKQGSPWFNQFLHSLTDGSEAQMKAIRQSFRDNGYAVDDQDAKGGYPVTRIGKKTNPIGMPVSFVTKLRTGTDDIERRAEISRFVIPRFDGSDDATEEDSLEDALDEFSDIAEDLDDIGSDKVSVDADDPWSV